MGQNSYDKTFRNHETHESHENFNTPWGLFTKKAMKQLEKMIERVPGIDKRAVDIHSCTVLRGEWGREAHNLPGAVSHRCRTNIGM